MPANTQKNEYKLQLYEQFARIGKALGSPRRLEIIDLLAQTDHTVEGLARKTEMSVANVSQHLQVLRAARLVAVRREGTFAYYRLADAMVLKVWLSINDLAQTHLLEIDDLMHNFFQQRASLEAIDAAELLERLRSESVILLDARPEDEYQAGHIPGAINLPLEALEAELNLQRDKEVVAYCRSAYCLLSDELALALQQRGYRVRVLDQGMMEWQRAGLPIKRTEEP
ncbi:MAG: metalloregulator ArsR/SmtB family transcription factor [Anaerolineae bacterium]|nr:metalloregulator ArsR/SmtB family transcription factor [Anaerolineae bacterium]